jgi:DNA-binding MarR family transcriptional regulator
MNKKGLSKTIVTELLNKGMVFWDHFRIFDERKGNTSLLHEEALKVLKENDDIKMADFAKALNITKPSATCLVQNMVESGLITRMYSLEDRRKIKIGLTKKGEETYKDMREEMIDEMRKIFCGVSIKDAKIYLKIQDILIDNMKEIQNTRGSKKICKE